MPGNGRVVVRVAAAVVDAALVPNATAGEYPDASFVGRVDGTVHGAHALDGWVVGVGPLAETIVAPKVVHPVRIDGGMGHESLALVPILYSLWAAVAHVAPQFGDRVLVCGVGLTARLAGQVTALLTGTAPRAVATAETVIRDQEAVRRGRNAGDRAFDILIDSTGDAAHWTRALQLVKRMGRAVLVVPPGRQIHSFDFYRNVHKASLLVSPRRVPAYELPGAWLPEAGSHLHQLLSSGAINLKGLLRRIDGLPARWAGYPTASNVSTEPAGLFFRFE